VVQTSRSGSGLGEVGQEVMADGGGGVGLDLEAEGVDPVVLQINQRGGLVRVSPALIL